MADKKSRRTQNVEFPHDQKREFGDQCVEASNLDPGEITISDEALDRAMRVYSPDEAMDLLACGAPGRSASTETWQTFLARMKRAPQTRATQRGIAEAERELMRRAPAGRG